MNSESQPATFWFFLRAIWCAIAHRSDHLLTKRMTATEIYRCPRCGVDHMRVRPDLFD